MCQPHNGMTCNVYVNFQKVEIWEIFSHKKFSLGWFTEEYAWKTKAQKKNENEVINEQCYILENISTMKMKTCDENPILHQI